MDADLQKIDADLLTKQREELLKKQKQVRPLSPGEIPPVGEGPSVLPSSSSPFSPPPPPSQTPMEVSTTALDIDEICLDARTNTEEIVLSMGDIDIDAEVIITEEATDVTVDLCKGLEMVDDAATNDREANDKGTVHGSGEVIITRAAAVHLQSKS